MHMNTLFAFLCDPLYISLLHFYLLFLPLLITPPIQVCFGVIIVCWSWKHIILHLQEVKLRNICLWMLFEYRGKGNEDHRSLIISSFFLSFVFLTFPLSSPYPPSLSQIQNDGWRSLQQRSMTSCAHLSLPPLRPITPPPSFSISLSNHRELLSLLSPLQIIACWDET